MEQVLTAWAGLQAVAASRDVTDAELLAAGVQPGGPGIRSELSLHRQVPVVNVTWSIDRVRREADVVLVEAHDNYDEPNGRTGLFAASHYLTFARDGRGHLRLVARSGDTRDGL